jgi:hypothetical protein
LFNNPSGTLPPRVQAYLQGLPEKSIPAVIDAGGHHTDLYCSAQLTWIFYAIIMASLIKDIFILYISCNYLIQQVSCRQTATFCRRYLNLVGITGNLENSNVLYLLTNLMMAH